MGGGGRGEESPGKKQQVEGGRRGRAEEEGKSPKIHIRPAFPSPYPSCKKFILLSFFFLPSSPRPRIETAFLLPLILPFPKRVHSPSSSRSPPKRLLLFPDFQAKKRLFAARPFEVEANFASTLLLFPATFLSQTLSNPTLAGFPFPFFPPGNQPVPGPLPPPLAKVTLPPHSSDHHRTRERSSEGEGKTALGLGTKPRQRASPQ